MSVSTAKHAIEFFKMHSIDNPNPVVAFYGGEPLLRFSEIKLITQYAEQVFEGKHISFRITTNCSLYLKIWLNSSSILDTNSIC